MRKARMSPDCPECGKKASKTHYKKRKAPFCTLRCAAAYGQRAFRKDPRCWDVWFHKWYHHDSFEGEVKFTDEEFYTTAVPAIWGKCE